MADKKLLAKHDADDGFFADDDPLAELARIVNFEPQGETRPKPVNARREPEFDLEDELLKEFEQYEAPFVEAPMLDVRAEEPRFAAEPQYTAEPRHVEEPRFEEARFEEPRFVEEPVEEPRVFDEVEPLVVAPEFEEQLSVPAETDFAAAPSIDAEPARDPEPVFEPEPEPVRQVPELRVLPEPAFEAPAEPVRPVSHPVFDLEDEILREFAAFDAKRTGQALPAEPAAFEAPIAAAVPIPAVEPVEPIQVAEEAVPAHVEPQFEALPEVAAFEAHDPESGYGDDYPVDDIYAAAETPVYEDAPLPDDAEVSLASWQETKEPILEEEIEPSSTAEVKEDEVEQYVEEPVHFEADFSAEQAWEDDVDPADEEPRYEQYEPVSVYDDVEPVAAFQPSDETDVAPSAYVEEPIAHAEESAEFQQHVQADEQQATGPTPTATEEDFGLDDLLAHVDPYPVTATAARWPVSSAVEAPAVEVPAVEVSQPTIGTIATSADDQFSVEEPVAAVEDDTSEIVPPPVAEAFDDGAFELDLSEIELDMLEMEVESSIAPIAQQDQIVASPAVLADVARANVESVSSTERNFVQVPRQAEDYSSLPFDPSQIAGDEDPVEALAELDVPEIPVADPEVPVAAQPDYDIDIDAEMAHIFARPVEPAVRPIGPRAMMDQAAAQQTAAKPAPVAPATDLDEFERALEEDFRRSLTENRVKSTPDRVALTPSAFDAGEQEKGGGRRWLALSASVAALVLLGGAGVYAFMGGNSKILSTSTEPKIILADKDPVKIVPENKGGQKVPNQDKAVYDRVSGENADVAKQERLVTSNEEPVDVVQKTLMPETLPMEDEDQANLTPTDDTADPRLLPEGKDKNISTTEKVVSGVSPRKVRTMVVRPDGTLVPREELTAEEAKAVAPAVEEKPVEAERSLELTPAVTEVPERLTPDATADKPAEATDADTKGFIPANDDVAKVLQEQPAVVEEKPVEQTTPVAATEEQPAVTTEEQPVATTEQQPAVTTEEKPAVTAEEKPAIAEVEQAEPVEAAPLKQEEVADVPAAQPEEQKTTDQTALTEAANAGVEETAPVRVVKTTTITDGNTPIPENRPIDQPVNVVGTVTDQGNVRDADKTQELASADAAQQPAENAQTTPVPAGGYVIQIASLPSEAEAQTSYNKLSAKFASVIGGRGVDIKRAQIKNKGTYYRVRIPAGSKQEAAELCSRYKAAGGSCLVSK
jgi:hypothetical protein